MDRKKIAELVKKAKESSAERKFKESFDLAINLKNVDVKKPEYKIEEYAKLPAGRGRKAKVCAFVGPELKEQAQKLCNRVVLDEQFSKFAEKRKVKTLARSCDYFIAPANLMPEIAKVFGRFFGPLGKMPNPKAGQILPPKGNIEPTVKRLEDTVKLQIKNAPVIHCPVGTKDMPEDKVADNIAQVVDLLEHKLPMGKNNIKSLVIKTTMGPSVRIEKW